MSKSEHLKKQLITAMEASLGVITTACRKVDVSRNTFYKYYREDEEFKKEIDDIENIALDFGESQLHQLMADGVASATIFFLKTKGKRRGYIEKQELDITSGDEPITIELNLTHEDKTGAEQETE